MAQQTKCRKKTEARREAILDAALEEFAAKGYAGARMEDIARRAGVAKGTLYLHFGDKEGLFNGLAESAFAPMHALAKEILDDKTHAFDAIVEIVVDVHLHPARLRIILFMFFM